MNRKAAADKSLAPPEILSKLKGKWTYNADATMSENWNSAVQVAPEINDIKGVVYRQSWLKNTWKALTNDDSADAKSSQIASQELTSEEPKENPFSMYLETKKPDEGKSYKKKGSTSSSGEIAKKAIGANASARDLQIFNTEMEIANRLLNRK